MANCRMIKELKPSKGFKEGSANSRSDSGFGPFLRSETANPRSTTASSQSPRTRTETTVSSPASSPGMSSQRNRAPRSGARGGAQEAGEEAIMWQKELLPYVEAIQNGEKRAKELEEQKAAISRQIKEIESKGERPLEELYLKLEVLSRESVKGADDQAAYLKEHMPALREKIGIMQAMVAHTEQNAGSSTGRPSNSRSAPMDFDRPSNSPGPSAPENKHVRKIGNGRTSSQPPRTSDAIPVQAVERSTNKPPKISFQEGDQVAFKRKISGKTDEHDWIQGEVIKVIGQDKSRRYDVRDPYPDETAAAGKPSDNIYRSSASQMVPIPPVDAPLGDYEIGRQVLALYPATSTFYRAEVKGMRIKEGKNEVELLFEDELENNNKFVERRMVLDHRG